MTSRTRFGLFPLYRKNFLFAYYEAAGVGARAWLENVLVRLFRTKETWRAFFRGNGGQPEIPGPTPDDGKTVIIDMKSTGAFTSNNGYIPTPQTFTTSDISFTANNFIPNTGQVKGSGSLATANFYINNTAFNGKIKTVTMTMATDDSSKTYFRNNGYCATGASAITTPAGAGTAGTISPDRMTITWTLDSNDSYFIISTGETFTRGNAKNVVITVECE